MGNDAGNTDLKGLNILSSKFGIRFNEDNVNMVKNDVYEQGEVIVPSGHPIFTTARRLFIKELATIETSKPASAIVTKDGKNVMAVSKYGKGTVFAIGDPWLYNEYVDGRKLTPGFDNYKAASDLVRWLIMQTKKK